MRVNYAFFDCLEKKETSNTFQADLGKKITKNSTQTIGDFLRSFHIILLFILLSEIEKIGH